MLFNNSVDLISPPVVFSGLSCTEKKEADFSKATEKKTGHTSGKRTQALNLKLVFQRKAFTSVWRYLTSTSAKHDVRMKHSYCSLSKHLSWAVELWCTKHSQYLFTFPWNFSHSLNLSLKNFLSFEILQFLKPSPLTIVIIGILHLISINSPY